MKLMQPLVVWLGLSERSSHVYSTAVHHYLLLICTEKGGGEEEAGGNQN